MKGKNSKYYKSILKMYFIIVAIYTIVIVGTFSYYSYDSFSSMNEKDMWLATEQIKQNVDQRLRLEESTTRQIVESENFSNVVLYNSYIDKLRFQMELNRICGYFVNRGSSITVLYSANKDEAISQDKLCTRGEFYSDMRFTPEEIEKIEYYIKNANAKESFEAATEVNGEERLIVFNKMKLYTSYNVVICYSYSYNYILENVYSKSNRVSVYKDGNLLISSSEYSENDEKKLTALIGNYKKGKEAPIISLDGGRHKAYVVSSNVKDWKYVITSDNSEHQHVVARIVLIAIFIFIIIISIGIIITKRFADVIYNPIKKLVDNAQIDDGNIDDELVTLKKAIERGKKYYNELGEKESLARKSLVRDILNGGFSVQELGTRIDEHSMQWLLEECFIVVFEITNTTELQKKLGDIDFYNVLDEMSEILSGKIYEAMKCETVRLSSHRFVTVVKGAKNAEIEKAIVEQINRIEYTTAAEIKVFMSDVTRGPGDIGREYIRISENVIGAMQKSHVIVEHSRGFINNDEFYYPIELEKNLIENVLKGSKESAKLAVDRLFENNIGEKSTKRDYTQLCFAINTTVNRILQMLDETRESVFGSDIKIYNELTLCNATEDIRIVTEAVFMRICDFVARQEDEIGRDLAEEMLHFVDENFQREISLCDIAEKFNYSINYISRAFTRETGRNFKDYLAMKRIAKAKDLLVMGNYTMTQVAAMVGYSNANSFIRIFKRVEGITPGQYVEKMKK